MNKIQIGCALAVVSLASFAGTTHGAGGGGTSVSGEPGYGWNVQGVCNPNRFAP